MECKCEKCGKETENGNYYCSTECLDKALVEIERSGGHCDCCD